MFVKLLNVKIVSINIPSPLDKIVFRSKSDLKNHLYIKRDDAIHPLISGNKWRKLSGHIIKTKESPNPRIVTCGGPWSNHILAAAAAASLHKIPITGLIRGNYHKYTSELLIQSKALGMELIFLSNSDFQKLQSDTVSMLSSLDLSQHTYIPLGGDDASGMQGCRIIVDEIISTSLRPDTWIIAAGTGTTSCGMLSNINYACDVYVFSAVNTKKEILKLDSRLNQIKTIANIVLLPPHRCPMGKVDQPFLDFVKEFHSQTNILLDPLYNGKMMEVFFSNRKSPISLEDKVVVYHSGGLFGWEGIKARYKNQYDFSFIP